MLLIGGNQNTWRKTCFIATLSNISPIWTDPGWKSGLLNDSLASSDQGLGTALLSKHSDVGVDENGGDADSVGRDRVVGIATRYGLDGPRIDSVGARFSARRPALGPTQPPLRLVPRSPPRGLRRPEHGVDHPPHLAPTLKEQ
jgi:hypothetical protein